MPFLAKGTSTYKHRVSLPGGRSAICSCGTTSRTTALAVAAFVRQLQARRDIDVLEAIVEKRVTLAEAYDAAGRNALDELVSKAGDADLSPLVTEWNGGGNAKYLAQVQRLIPKGESFPVSQFRRREISKFLAELTDVNSEGRTDKKGKPIPPRPASPATKNRYRAALSVFAKWLVEREILETNVVRDVGAARVPRRKIIFLEPEQVQTLVDGLPNPYRVFEALLAGTGIEYSAAAQVRKRDIDLEARTVHAQGTKTGYRDRYVEVTEEWAWKIVEAYAKPLSPNAPLFPELREDAALDVHDETARVLGLPRTTLHQHRHSFAVMHLRRGCDHQWLKNQLGHSPTSTLIYTTYGVYIGAAKLTATQQARMPESKKSATAAATTAKVVSRKAR